MNFLMIETQERGCDYTINKNTTVGAREQYHEDQRRLERAMCAYQHKDKP